MVNLRCFKNIKELPGTADGFLTVRTKEYLGDQYSVHMYHLTESRDPNEQNLLFVCGKANEHTADTFNCLGCRILSMCSDCSLLIMDELGPHEAKAALFREEILHLLDGQIPVLGVLQEPAEACWPEIVNHPNVEIITLSESNRNNSSCVSIFCRIFEPSGSLFHSGCPDYWSVHPAE